MRTSLAVLALVLGLAGCGGETTEEDKVRSALVDFSHAFADADGDKACELMTDEFKVLFASNTDTDAKDCPAAVRTAAARLDKPTADALRAVKVTERHHHRRQGDWPRSAGPRTSTTLSRCARSQASGWSTATSPLKNAMRSAARSSGSSAAAKWPPRGMSVKRRTS